MSGLDRDSELECNRENKNIVLTALPPVAFYRSVGHEPDDITLRSNSAVTRTNRGKVPPILEKSVPIVMDLIRLAQIG